MESVMLARGRPPLQRVVEKILTRGFSEMDVDASILAEHIPAIKWGMRDMTNDASVHPIFAEQVLGEDEMGWKQEAGLIERNDKERKFFFHYQSPAAEWPFPDHTCLKRFAPFLESCGVLTARARAIANGVAQTLDTHLRTTGRNYNLAEAMRGSRAVTRVLRYLPLEGDRAGNADAYAHMDRAFLTIHWWASVEGLLIFDEHCAAHRIAEIAWDRVAVFPGKKFFGLTQGACGMKGIHGVRDSRVTRDEDRIAIVTFVHANLTPEAVALMHASREAFKDAEMHCVL